MFIIINGSRLNNHLNYIFLEMKSKHYDASKLDLYFEQGFIIEGTLGYGSFGKVNWRLKKFKHFKLNFQF